MSSADSAWSRVTRSEEETIACGREIALQLPRRAVVLLTGNLGAGKTTLAKGILSGLGVAAEEEVSSPTFTLIHEYPTGRQAQELSRRAFHIDLYRLDTPREIESIGFEEFLYDPKAISCVEWGEKASRLLPGKAYHVKLHVINEHSRQIQIRHTKKANRRVQAQGR